MPRTPTQARVGPAAARRARAAHRGPADLDQIGALLTERGDEHDAVDHRLVVEDPDLGWAACAVVVDGARVVATATLLDEVRVRVGDVVLPAGQVELVAVAASHEHRGLARALMDWAHRRSAARGHVLQVMIGIPYFYRRFGYEYAIDIPPARELVERCVPGLGAAGTERRRRTVSTVCAAGHGRRPAGPRRAPGRSPGRVRRRRAAPGGPLAGRC